MDEKEPVANEKDKVTEQVIEEVVEEVQEKSYATVDDVTGIVETAIEKLEESLFKKIQAENLNKPVTIKKEIVKEEPKETKPLFL